MMAREGSLYYYIDIYLEVILISGKDTRYKAFRSRFKQTTDNSASLSMGVLGMIAM